MANRQNFSYSGYWNLLSAVFFNIGTNVPWRRSTHPLDSGWYGEVCIFSICCLLHNWVMTLPVRLWPWSDKMVRGNLCLEKISRSASATFSMVENVADTGRQVDTGQHETMSRLRSLKGPHQVNGYILERHCKHWNLHHGSFGCLVLTVALTRIAAGVLLDHVLM